MVLADGLSPSLAETTVTDTVSDRSHRTILFSLFRVRRGALPMGSHELDWPQLLMPLNDILTSFVLCQCIH